MNKVRAVALPSLCGAFIAGALTVFVLGTDMPWRVYALMAVLFMMGIILGAWAANEIFDNIRRTYENHLETLERMLGLNE